MAEEPSPMAQTTSGIANPGNELDRERLKYITTTASGDPLGLALIGAGFATSQMIDVYWHGSHWTGLGVLLMVGAVVVGLVYIPRYYVSRFGWVQQLGWKPPALSGAQFAIGIVILVAMWLAAGVIEGLIRPYVNFWVLMQSFGVLCIIVYAAFSPRGRFMPVRLTIWAALALSQALLAVLPLMVLLSPSQMLLWKALNAGSIGILLMVVGLCDHVAMVRLLPKRGAEDEHE